MAQLDRDTEAASTALDAAVAALVVAERDALVATDVTTSFDSAARELAAFRNSGVAELDAASQKCQERSDAAERDHVELTAAAKLSVTSLSFRDYLRFGLTP